MALVISIRPEIAVLKANRSCRSAVMRLTVAWMTRRSSRSSAVRFGAALASPSAISASERAPTTDAGSAGLTGSRLRACR